METKLRDTVNSLEDLLDKERAALLSGNLDLIDRMSVQKEKLIDVLNLHGGSKIKKLAALNIKVQRNQVLFESALDGIRSVAERLATMRRVKNSLDTYDAHGKRKKIEMPSKGEVEKRA
jgi:flagellar biosynthesis/type III secretory pathway chaperone